MNPGQIYAIKIPSNPYQSMRPVPFSMYGSPCKNKCMKIKKNLKPKTEMDHDYLVDIMNMLDGSMDMPNVRVKSNMFQPTLISAFKIKSKSKKGKKKKGETKKKGKKTMKFPLKSLTETLSLPSLLSEDFLSDSLLSKPRIKTEKRKKKKKKDKKISSLRKKLSEKVKRSKKVKRKRH